MEGLTNSKSVGIAIFTLKRKDGDYLKCYGCGWHVSNLYVLANSPEHAAELFNRSEGGLCGDCFGEMLSQGKVEVEPEE